MAVFKEFQTRHMELRRPSNTKTTAGWKDGQRGVYQRRLSAYEESTQGDRPSCTS